MQSLYRSSEAWAVDLVSAAVSNKRQFRDLRSLKTQQLQFTLRS